MDRIAPVPDRGTTFALTALRIGVGLVLAVHGTLKLLDVPGTIAAFGSLGIPYPHIAVYLAIAGELLGGVGLALGALTRVAALGPLFTMLGAIWWAHRHAGLLAQEGGFEYPLVLLLVSLYFVFRGAGPVSVDAAVARRRALHPTSGYAPYDTRPVTNH